MKSFNFLLFLIVQISIDAQSEYSQNLWNSLVIQKKLKTDQLLTADFGHRTYDRFIYKQRNSLGRITFEKQLRSHFIGIGYAEFLHIKEQSDERRQYETRPFIQYRFQKQIRQFILAYRLRNEFRFFHYDHTLVNRIRLQLQTRLSTLNKLIKPVLNAEIFYSANSKKHWESRFQTGILSEWNSRVQSLVSYTLQNQSLKKGGQHIIGLQLQFNLN